MRIEIWSDFCVPHCYTGETLLIRALEELGVRSGIEIKPRAFELDPSFPKGETIDVPQCVAKKYVDSGKGDQMLPFPFMGWAPMVARTAWQWLWRNPLDNVHSDPDGDFSEVEKIKQTGALIIGTYDRFSYGEPKAFIELINSHMQNPDQNEVIFVQGTGHVYTEREQMLANIILRLAEKWQ